MTPEQLARKYSDQIHAHHPDTWTCSLFENCIAAAIREALVEAEQVVKDVGGPRDAKLSGMIVAHIAALYSEGGPTGTEILQRIQPTIGDVLSRLTKERDALRRRVEALEVKLQLAENLPGPGPYTLISSDWIKEMRVTLRGESPP